MTSLAHLHRETAADAVGNGGSILNEFAVVLSMGGAVDHPGNTSPVRLAQTSRVT